MPVKVIKIGDVIGRQKVVSHPFPTGKSQTNQFVMVLCSCGNKRFVRCEYLRRKNCSLSCGCLQKEFVSGLSRKIHIIHDMTNTREHKIWREIKRRCEGRNIKRRKNYGDRGISICDRWKDFLTFFKDMGECPPGYSIERIDVNGNYEPKNCKWIPKNHQARNTRRTRRFAINGKTKTILELSEMFYISPKVIRDRINKLGWTIEKAISVPVTHKFGGGK